MSHHPITIDELVSAHRADLLSEACNDDLAQQAILARAMLRIDLGQYAAT